jgi:hypothetical protein
MRVVMLLSVICSLVTSTLQAEECDANKYFKHLGWEVHRCNEFKKIARRMLPLSQSLPVKHSAPFISGSLNGKWIAYEDITTPRKEMWEDLIFFTRESKNAFASNDIQIKDVVEIRWHEGKKRHVVYKRSQQCVIEQSFFPVNGLI